MTPEAQIDRGQRAERMLADDLFKDAVKAIRDKAMDDFKAAKPDDPIALSQARTLYDVTESFVNVFMGHVRDGQFEKRKLLDKEKHTPKHSTFP